MMAKLNEPVITIATHLEAFSDLKFLRSLFCLPKEFGSTVICMAAKLIRKSFNESLKENGKKDKYL